MGVILQGTHEYRKKQQQQYTFCCCCISLAALSNSTGIRATSTVCASSGVPSVHYRTSRDMHRPPFHNPPTPHQSPTLQPDSHPTEIGGISDGSGWPVGFLPWVRFAMGSPRGCPTLKPPLRNSRAWARVSIPLPLVTSNGTW